MISPASMVVGSWDQKHSFHPREKKLFFEPPNHISAVGAVRVEISGRPGKKGPDRRPAGTRHVFPKFCCTSFWGSRCSLCAGCRSQYRTREDHRRLWACKWDVLKHACAPPKKKKGLSKPTGDKDTSPTKPKKPNKSPKKARVKTPTTATAPDNRSSAVVSVARGRRLFWLHIPKAGTSFGTSVAVYGTHPTRNLGNEHQSLSKARDEDQISNAVAMFRDPDQRLLSAYHWIKARRGCCTGDWGWPGSVFSPIHSAIRSGNPPSNTIAPFKGCMTSMVLGFGCMSRTKLSQASIVEAKSRISQFKFVGLEIQWRRSICLFNFIMTGRRFVQQRQLGSVQPGIKRGFSTVAIAKASVHRYDPDLLGPSHYDSADTSIYNHVEERFERECAEYGISDETCPME